MPAAAKYVRRPCERRDPYAAAAVLKTPVNDLAQQQQPVVMGPCVRRDDGVATAGISFQE
jgi:hypothetical protein